jgi:hypothetical protein
LLPGIWTHTLEFTSVWTDTTRLESILADIASGSDGSFLVEVKTSLTTSMAMFRGVILPESITVPEQANNVQVTFRATDGLALLKDTKYNDDGDPYTNHATVIRHIKNVQEKLLTWDRMVEDRFSNFGTASRIAFSEMNVSVDDELYSLQPPSMNSGTGDRMRIHHRTFHKKNSDGVNEYYSAWDVLESICLTFNLTCTLYYDTLFFLPAASLSGTYAYRLYRYDDTTLGVDWEYEIPFNGVEGNYNTVKGANWARTFTPPIGEVTLTRRTQGSQGVIYSTQDAPGTTLYDTDETYSYQWFQIRGAVRIQKDGDATLTGANRLYRFAPTFSVRIGPDGGTNYYLRTNTQGTSWANMTALLDEGTEFQNAVNYHYLNNWPIYSGGPTYEWTTNSDDVYVYRSPMNDGRFWLLHDGKNDIDDVLHFEFNVLFSEPGVHQSLQITPSFRAYNAQSQLDTDYLTGATINFIELGVYRLDKGQAQSTDSFTYRAQMDSGRRKVDLGETLIGDRGASTYFGGIEVYDGTDWVASSGWVNQDQATPRTINRMAVEEVAAHHKRAKQIERGTLYILGNFDVEAVPNVRFKDIATGIYYTTLSQKYNFTQASWELTLFRIGRNFQDINVYTDGKETDSISTFVKPSGNDNSSPGFQVDTETQGMTQTYHNRAAIIGEAWDTADVIDGATLEYYWTVNVDGIGIWADHQGEVPTTNFQIQRKVYLVSEALADGDSSGWSSPAGAQPAQGDTLAQTLLNVQTHLAKLTNAASTYTIIVAYDEVSTSPILDTYSGAIAAYSLRKLRAAYSGSAINVRRTVNPASTDIGFTAQGDLDTSALFTFSQGGDVFVQKIYDQTGNGHVLFQTGSGAQPQIVSSGTVLTLNGKAAMSLNGSQTLPATTSFNINPNTNELVVAWVGAVTDLASNNVLVSQWKQGNNANQVMEIQSRGDTDNLRYMHRYSNGTLSTVDNGSAITSGAQYIVVGHTEQNKNEAWFDGTKQTGANVNAAPNSVTEGFRIGARSDSSINPHTGYTQEVIIWSTVAQNHDSASISDTINDYYGSY